MITRQLSEVINLHKLQFPAILLIGPRQSGKTTLARSIGCEKSYFNFETPSTEEQFLTDPISFLSNIKNEGAILDEVQRVPEILRYLQQKLDEDRTPGKYLITGSQNILLNEHVSQSLAGRISVDTLLPCTVSEFATSQDTQVWDRIFSGSYPQVLFSDVDPVSWNQSYIHTYIERDVRQLKNIGNLSQFKSFLKAIAARTSQLLNKQQLSDDLGISDTTIAEWLSLLEATYLVFLIPAWIPSVSKRYSHATKLVMLDTGVCSSLLGFNSAQDLSRYSYNGFLFESWVTSEIIKSSVHRNLRYEFFYIRNYNGVEIDLIAKRGEEFIGIEIKSSKTFSESLLKSFFSLEKSGVKFSKKIIVWGGDDEFSIKGIEVVSWRVASKIL